MSDHDDHVFTYRPPTKRGIASPAPTRHQSVEIGVPYDEGGHKKNLWRHKTDTTTEELEVDDLTITHRSIDREGNVTVRVLPLREVRSASVQEIHNGWFNNAAEAAYGVRNSWCVRYVLSQPCYLLLVVIAWITVVTAFEAIEPGSKSRGRMQAAASLFAIVVLFITVWIVLSSWYNDCCTGLRRSYRRARRRITKDSELDPCCGVGFGRCIPLCRAEEGQGLCCPVSYFGCCAPLACVFRGLSCCCPGGYTSAGYSTTDIKWTAWTLEWWYKPGPPPSRLGGSDVLDIPENQDLLLREKSAKGEAAASAFLQEEADDMAAETTALAIRGEKEREETEFHVQGGMPVFLGLSMRTLLWSAALALLVFPGFLSCAVTMAYLDHQGEDISAGGSDAKVCDWRAQWGWARLNCQFYDPYDKCPSDTDVYQPNVPVVQQVHDLIDGGNNRIAGGGRRMSASAFDAAGHPQSTAGDEHFDSESAEPKVKADSESEVSLLGDLWAAAGALYSVPRSTAVALGALAADPLEAVVRGSNAALVAVGGARRRVSVAAEVATLVVGGVTSGTADWVLNPWGDAWEVATSPEAINPQGITVVYPSLEDVFRTDIDSELQEVGPTSAAGPTAETGSARRLQASPTPAPGGGTSRYNKPNRKLPYSCEATFDELQRISDGGQLPSGQATAFQQAISVFNAGSGAASGDRRDTRITEDYASVLASAVPSAPDATCGLCKTPFLPAFRSCVVFIVFFFVFVHVAACMGTAPVLPMYLEKYFPRPTSVLDISGRLRVDLGDYRNAESALRYIQTTSYALFMRNLRAGMAAIGGGGTVGGGAPGGGGGGLALRGRMG